MIELKVIHNGLISKKLSEWSKAKRIDGFTTLFVARSYGSKDGPFHQDLVSGEKYMSFIFFKDDELEKAESLKKEIEDLNFFVVLSNTHS